MQSYILMIDYGKGLEGPNGFEAVVHPEQTRREIVSEVRKIFVEPRGRRVVFVKYSDLDENNMIDVTEEIFSEAEATLLEVA